MRYYPITFGSIWLLTIFISSTSALNILGIETVPSPSHHFWFSAFMRGLARDGHNIHALSILPTKGDKNGTAKGEITSYIFEGYLEKFQTDGNIDSVLVTDMNGLELNYKLYMDYGAACVDQMATEGAKKVLELVKNTKFDAIIYDLTLGQCSYVLSEFAQGNPVLIGFTPFGLPSWTKDIVGGNNWPAIKNHQLFTEVPPFNLWQKICNYIYFESDDLIRRYLYLPEQQKYGEKIIGKKMSRSFAEIEKNFTILFTNSHPTFEPATFYPPNLIQVGGLHIEKPKPLPQDIKKFLDEAEHGAIMISFGSNVKTSMLGAEKIQAIISALSQLKQRVLWKFDSDDTPIIPKNVMIKKWLPQNDVVAHPKIRAVWTHCGLLSSQEAIWWGVPIIGTPFFMDQKLNIKQISGKGIGINLEHKTLTTEKILEVTNKILTDPSYTQRMKEFSREFRDRPMSPLDEAVWYVKYAVRNPRGPLSSPGKYMSWWELNFIDVYAVFGLILFLIFWTLQYILRLLINSFKVQKKDKTM